MVPSLSKNFSSVFSAFYVFFVRLVFLWMLFSKCSSQLELDWLSAILLANQVHCYIKFATNQDGALWGSKSTLIDSARSGGLQFSRRALGSAGPGPQSKPARTCFSQQIFFSVTAPPDLFSVVKVQRQNIAGGNDVVSRSKVAQFLLY